MKKQLLTCAIILALQGSAYAQADIAVPIDAYDGKSPVNKTKLPVSVIRSEVDYAKETQQAAIDAPPPADLSNETAPPVMHGATRLLDRFVKPALSSTVTVKSGTTEIIPIAANFLTRIVTPFKKPEVKTANDVEIDVVGSTVFLLPTTDMPAGVFIFDQAEPESAITLQLIPQDIPQRDINLRLVGGNSNYGDAGQKHGKGSEDPHSTNLMNILIDLAKGKIPKSFALASEKNMDAYRCDLPGLHSSVGQVLESSQFRVAVSLVQNNGFRQAVIDEKWCARSGVAAIAAWPNVVLEPGEMTELFVIHYNANNQSPAGERPSLISNRGGK